MASASLLGQSVSVPQLVLKDVPFRISWENVPVDGNTQVVLAGLDSLIVVKSSSGSARVKKTTPGSIELRIGGETAQAQEVLLVPGWTSLLPPLVAIILALVTKEMLLSLFTGVWVGAIILSGFHPWAGFLRALDTQVVNSLVDKGHATILLFTFGFGGLIGLIQRNGGIAGIVAKAERFASNRIRGQLATALMGVLIFFDDYANSLLVGNTMRPITDRLRISREKLSYIVDSTAAPVASFGLISTWIVFSMSLLDSQLRLHGVQTNSYLLFLLSIPFSYYSILAVILVFLVAVSNREIGPMYGAERRAILEGRVIRIDAKPISDDSLLENVQPKGIPFRWWNAGIPIAFVILFTMVGMLITGLEADPPRNQGTLAFLLAVMNNADSAQALLWASFTGALVAALLGLGQRLISIKDTMEAWFQGARTMLLASMILILAWALGEVCNQVHTADYIIHNTRHLIAPFILPALTFLTASAISFATGTSFGTMSILIPLVIPLALNIYADVHNLLFLATFAAVISGATFGDHCSPISDTTILSSLASCSDHIDHVRTQLPYAFIAGTIAVLIGYLPLGLWQSQPFIGIITSYVVAISALFLILKVWGKPLPSSTFAKAEA